MSEINLTHRVKYSKLQLQKAQNIRHSTNMKTITLQIPFDKYGTLATLAAAANMPIDDYVRQPDVTPTPAPAEK